MSRKKRPIRSLIGCVWKCLTSPMSIIGGIFVLLDEETRKHFTML